MQADKKCIESLMLSGLLHDMGKIAIPDSVLHKEGTLTEEEREMIKLHTLKGQNPSWKNEFLFGEEGDMIGNRQFTGQIK